MDFFISDAFAQAPSQGQDYAGLIIPVLLLLIFYFLFIRPQSKRTKEHKKMVEALVKGSEVVTNGGLLGKVVSFDENFVKIEVADNVQVQIQRSGITSLMPKGTYKSQSQKTKSKTN